MKRFEGADIVGRKGRWRPQWLQAVIDQIDLAMIAEAARFIELYPSSVASVTLRPVSHFSYEMQTDADEVHVVVMADATTWLSVRPSFAPEDLFEVDLTSLLAPSG